MLVAMQNGAPEEVILWCVVRGKEDPPRNLRPDLAAVANSALVSYARRGDAAFVFALLAAGANVNAVCEGRTALMVAARVGSTAVVDALLEAGATVDHQRDGDGQSALMIAAKAGSTNVVGALLNAGANANTFDHHAWTPLMYATLSATSTRSCRFSWPVEQN